MRFFSLCGLAAGGGGEGGDDKALGAGTATVGAARELCRALFLRVLHFQFGYRRRPLAGPQRGPLQAECGYSADGGGAR